MQKVMQEKGKVNLAHGPAQLMNSHWTKNINSNKNSNNNMQNIPRMLTIEMKTQKEEHLMKNINNYIKKEL